MKLGQDTGQEDKVIKSILSKSENVIHKELVRKELIHSAQLGVGGGGENQS